MPERSVYDVAVELNRTFADRNVLLVDLPVAELARYHVVDRLVLDHEYHAARIPVQAMHNTGSQQLSGFAKTLIPV